MALRPGRRRQRMVSDGTASPSRGQRLNRCLQRTLALNARQLVAQTEVDPRTKRQVSIGPPREIKSLRVQVGCRIQIGGRQQGHDPVPFSQPNPAELNISLHKARFAKLHRRDDAEELLNG